MGYVHAKIQLKNPRLQKLKPISTKAMVDTGALMLCIPAHIAIASLGHWLRETKYYWVLYQWKTWI